MTEHACSALHEDDVIHHLQRGALLLCDSSTNVAAWKQRYVHAMQGVCETPAIHTWQTWTQALAMQCHDVPVPLTPLQEQQLWQHIIHEDSKKHDLSLSPIAKQELATQAMRAYQIMRDYDIPLQALQHRSMDETQAFYRWLCAIDTSYQHGVLAKRILAADVRNHLPAMPLPATILLDQISALTSNQQTWLDSLSQSTWRHIKPSRAPALQTTAHTYPDTSSEIQHVAREISAYALQHPDATIGVVSANPNIDWLVIAQAIQTAMEPESLYQLHAGAWVATPANKLSEHPIIQQLWHILEILSQPFIEQQRLERILIAPFFMGDADEQRQRMQLSQRMHKQNRENLSIKQLLSMPNMDAMPVLQGIFQALESYPTSRKEASAWARDIQQLLQRMGIPKPGTEQSAATYIFDQFLDAVAKLSELDLFATPISASHALQVLKRCCHAPVRETSIRYPNIKLMPLEEAAGLRFDALWVCQMDARYFPAKVFSSPLLPTPLLRTYDVPFAQKTAARTIATQYWEALQCCATQIRISYAAIDQGIETLPTPLVRQWEKATVTLSNTTPIPVPVEHYNPTPSVALTQTIRGGSYLLKAQAACPFAAFVQFRLGLTSLEPIETGVRAKDKGSLVHYALEHIWGVLGNHANLLRHMEDKQLFHELIMQGIEQAFQRASLWLNHDMKNIERMRLQRMIEQWLCFESTRPPFQVLERESKYTLHIPASQGRQLQIHVSVDRIDQDEHGNIMVMDYKTGSSVRSAWFGERLKEPQLPLYALIPRWSISTFSHDISAVALARVRSNDVAFEGVCHDDIGIKGIVPYTDADKASLWDELLDIWAEKLSTLASEILDGQCDATPMKGACEYCELQAACRIDELQPHPLENDDDI